MPPTPKQYIIITNGEKVHVNDHVYVSPPWELRDGIPYSIARIMEFMPPDTDGIDVDPPADLKGKGREKDVTRVRLAWYYRPSDLSDRVVADSRLLFAAIFSEIQPVAFLRAKCHVKHKDKIADLSGWKRRPDRFYFTKLFDPYIKKDYEIIRSGDVRNLPDNIRHVLQSRYEFVIAEKEVVSDLTDTLHECDTCALWCPTPETVQCDICKLFFHMHCVQPPLLAKPAKGYGWTCAPCTVNHEERIERKLARSITPVKPKPAPKAKPQNGEGPKARLMSTEDRYFKMWPYRLYTVAEDTLDPDDMIFPRAATRIGNKFQCVIPNYLGPWSQDSFTVDEQMPVRGGDGTVEVLGSIVHMPPEEIEKVEVCKVKTLLKPEHLMHVDYLTEIIRKYSEVRATGDYEGVRLKTPTRSRKWEKGTSRWIDKDWSPAEIAIFEKGLETWNAELSTIAGDLEGRTTADLVRFYGHWKNARLGEENRKIRESSQALLQVIPTTFRRMVSVRSSADPDDEGSVVNGQLENGASSKSLFCGSCRTRDSTVWWKGPKSLPSPVMCDVCGIAWRKYGDIKGPVKLEEPAPPKKIGNGVAEKRAASPPPAPPVVKRHKPTPVPNKHGACACCRKVGLSGTVVKCAGCNLVVHASAYGVSKAEAVIEPWYCEVCANEKHQEFALVADCLLCPRPPFAPAPPAAKGSSGEFLRAWKPTEGRGWVHAICSIFIPEVQYTDAAQLRFVEGMSSLPSWRWQEACTFCKQTGGGAVVKCPDCDMKFHLSCAWRNQLRFGFELTPKKAQDPDGPPLITFRGVLGILEPFVWCNAHILEQNRIVWGPCDASEGETALQLYCRTYKQVPLEHSYGLLRRAYRLDQALAVPERSRTPGLSYTPPINWCCKCGSSYTPYFWPVDEPPKEGDSSSAPGKPRVICHRCKFNIPRTPIP